MTPDGSPVDVYLALAAGPVPGMLHDVVPAHATVLDLGCGVGRIGGELVRLGHPVTGVDESAEMLVHAAARGVEPVHSRIEGLALGRHFDVVLLASRLVSVADERQRRDFWTAAALHVADGGLVIVERHHPDWVRTAEPERRAVAGVDVELHDVLHERDLIEASVTYRLHGHEWSQHLRAVALDDDAFVAEAQGFGLAFVRWLDDRQEWGLLQAAGGQAP